MDVLDWDFRFLRKALFLAVAAIGAVVAAFIAIVPAGSAPVAAEAGIFPVQTINVPAFPEGRPRDDTLLAKGKFLVASRTIADPWFQETVVLLIAYDSSGATGLIINRPTKVALAEMLPSVSGLKKRSDIVYYGGPVEGQRLLMLIRSDERLDESDNVFLNVYVSVSKNTLDRMIDAHKTQEQLRVYSGYAGWMTGQLKREMARGDWYIIDADADTVFKKKPSAIWHELIRRSSAIEVREHDNEGKSIASDRSWLSRASIFN